MSGQIRISPELKRFLDNQAVKKDDSYDQIIKRLLKKCWGVEFEEADKP